MVTDCLTATTLQIIAFVKDHSIFSEIRGPLNH